MRCSDNGKMKEWNSETYGKLNIPEIPEKMLEFYHRNLVYGEPIEITLGTDSQDHNTITKMVSVISIICRGHGGIFFHTTQYIEKPHTVKEKLEIETNKSLDIAQELIGILETDYKVLYDNCPFSIHIDAGNAPYGKTKDLIQSLTGWVHAMGYDCEVKPMSYAASTIADRISK